MSQKITFCLEMCSLIAFLIAYKMYGLICGTKVLMVTSIISLVCLFILNKKVTWAQVIPVIVIQVMGGITVLSNDPTFIKMKPTILYGLVSCVLTVGLLCKKAFIKKMFEKFFDMDDDKWRKLTMAWAVFFAGCAGLNELVWRNFSEPTWVLFKVFAFMPLMLCFLIGQLFVLRKHLKEL